MVRGSLSVTSLPLEAPAFEVVERKGAGHPDSICDALAENLSRELCRLYRDRFGTVLHHNVDKALLRAGRAAPAFGGGAVLEPIEIYLAGRAAAHLDGQSLALDDLAVDSARAWLRGHLRALDPERHVRIQPLLRPGSSQLQQLFSHEGGLAGDTSIGVGYAPLSDLERLVTVLDSRISSEAAKHAWGEDVKIMAVRSGEQLDLTISCAMIDRGLASMAAYLAEKQALAAFARAEAAAFGFERCRVEVNAADRPESGQAYLTVTGTSAEAGDDGQVGRGNRVNGLITPMRPMSLEAAAGKNPVTHVGKVYNVVCHDIAEALVAELPPVAAAQCLMVSRIGRPITEPAHVDVRLATFHPDHGPALKEPVRAVVSRLLDDLPSRLDDFIDGRVSLF